MKRLFVIQEHNATAAGLHWDLRFETDSKVLRSFAVPKHRLPDDSGERLLAIPTEDHPWSYRDFDGVIKSGYGAGTVKLLFSDEVEVTVFTTDKIKFIHEQILYSMFIMKGTPKWLITRGVTEHA